MAVSAALPPPAAAALSLCPLRRLPRRLTAWEGHVTGRWRRQGPPRSAVDPAPQPLPQGKTLKDVFEAFCSFGAGGGPVAGLEGRMFSK